MTQPRCPACAGLYPGDGPDPLVCQCGTDWQTKTAPATRPAHTPTENHMSSPFENRNAEILDLYGQNIPVKEIAAKYGITSARVTQIASAAKVPLRRPQNAPKGIDTAKVITAKRAGLSVAEIAAQNGVTESTIRHHLDHRRAAA